MKWLTLLLLMYSFPSFAQPIIVKEIKGTDPSFKKEQYSFPQVIVVNNAEVTDRINNDLLQDFLQIDPKSVKRSIFENVWVTKNHRTPSLSDVRYEVIDTNKNVLTLGISAEGCGAYCEDFTNYYTYDVRTGKRLTLDTLFTMQGSTNLVDTINMRRRKAIAAQLKMVEDSLLVVDSISRKEDYEQFKEEKELYTDCLDRTIDDLQFIRFYITAKHIFLLTDRCSAHYNRAIDELDDIRITLDTPKWCKYLIDRTLFQWLID